MPASENDHLVRLADADARRALARAGLTWSAHDANLCRALRYQSQATQRAAIVGLVGGASSGKSTVFNSLIGREASLISAHAHETLGAIVAVRAERISQVEQWIEQGLLFGDLRVTRAGLGLPLAGSADTLHLVQHDRAALAGIVLCDLPDVTSKSSADEGAVARNQLPYFDALIVVADEERDFDAAVFERFLADAQRLGPRAFVVFNRTERGEPLTEAQRTRLENVAKRNGAVDHCISPYRPGSGYRPVSAETGAAVTSWLSNLETPDRRRELAARLQERSSAVIAENLARTERWDKLLRSVDQELVRVAEDTRLTLDLLTAGERELLGLGHRYVPLYDLARQARGWISLLAGKRSRADVDFDKSPEGLAAVLQRNLTLRCARATARVDGLVAISGYFDAAANWENQWSPPAIDANEWAQRIRAHIDAWKADEKTLARRGDWAAVFLGTPLLVADLLFLGGAGFSTGWLVASAASFLSGKGLARAVQGSAAYAAYQTTVKAYQAVLKEALVSQWEANVARMPRRHLPMGEPIMAAMLRASTPGRS